MRTTPWTAACLCLLLSACQWASQPETDPVEMRGGLPGNEYVDHTFEGRGFKGFDGLKVHVRLGGPEPLFFCRERTASLAATIEDGRFRLFLPQAREVNLYKPFVLFADVNGDGLCNPGRDLGFRGATSGTRFDYVQEAAQEAFQPMKPEDCDFSSGRWLD